MQMIFNTLINSTRMMMGVERFNPLHPQQTEWVCSLSLAHTN